MATLAECLKKIALGDKASHFWNEADHAALLKKKGDGVKAVEAFIKENERQLEKIGALADKYAKAGKKPNIEAAIDAMMPCVEKRAKS